MRKDAVIDGPAGLDQARGVGTFWVRDGAWAGTYFPRRSRGRAPCLDPSAFVLLGAQSSRRWGSRHRTRRTHRLSIQALRAE